MEFSIKTSQELSMFDLFLFDGGLAQVIGYAGDYTLCEYIDQDDSAETIDLDVDSITEYTESEVY